MMNVAILDDYANAALRLADWTPVAQHAKIQIFTRHLPDREMIAALQPFEIVCTLRERSCFSAETFAQLPNLKMIVVTDGHVTTIDNDAAAARGILVCEGKAPDDMSSAPSSIGEFAWALMLAAVRHIPEESQRLRRGEWQHSLGYALAGHTLGIVGLGRVGTRMAHYARAFDMQVLAWSQNLTDEVAEKTGAKRVEKEFLFRNSDIVSLHYVLSGRSRGLVGQLEIAAMKPTAYLINTSRGPLVDEAALITALQEKRIAGAGLDVFDQEPLPRDHPFCALDNVTMTPHLGFVTEVAMRRFYAGAALAAAAYLRGQPANILNTKAPVANRER
jgi:phosphoglycerate dehydrogenase-like enzyme